MRQHKSCDDGTARLGSRITCTLSIVAIILSSACLIFDINTLANNSASQKATAHEDFVCVECAKLTRGPIDAYTRYLIGKLSTCSKGGLGMCCAHTSDQMAVLMELVLQKTNAKREPVQTYDPENSTYSSVSAHKRLLPSVPYISKADLVPQFSNDSNVPLLFESENEDVLVEHVRNVEVMTTGIYVLYSGLYYIYSSIRFNPDSSKPCRHFDQQTWSHDVLRSRPNERQSSGVILSSLHTCCDNCTRNKETSYTGGAFYLQAGDHLHVEVSGYALIRFDKQASYFGLYMLAGKE